MKGIFRIKSIFRTMVYLELEAYSEHYQTSTIESFEKTRYLVHFLIFCEAELIYISGNKTFQPYISGSNSPNSISKKNPLLKSFLYFGKQNFLAPSLKYYFMRELVIFSHISTKEKCFLPFSL